MASRRQAWVRGVGPVDFIRQKDIGHDRPGEVFKFRCLLIEIVQAGDIGWQEIGRELDTLEYPMQGHGHGFGQHGLTTPPGTSSKMTWPSHSRATNTRVIWSFLTDYDPGHVVDQPGSQFMNGSDFLFIRFDGCLLVVHSLFLHILCSGPNGLFLRRAFKRRQSSRIRSKAPGANGSGP